MRLDLVKSAKRHGRRRGAHDKKRDHHFEIVRRSESERICKYDPGSRSSCKLGRVGYMRLVASARRAYGRRKEKGESVRFLGSADDEGVSARLCGGLSFVATHAFPWCVRCVPGFGCGLARESVGGVGFEVVLVRFVCLSRER